MAEEENNLIELTDEEGNVIECALYDIIDFEDKQYAILADMSVEEEGDMYDTIITTYKEEDGTSYFETIEDDEEFDRVSEYVDKILDEEELDEDEE